MFGAASLHLLLLRVLTMTRLLAELALASIICLVWLPAGEAFLVPSAAQLPLGKVSIPPLTCGAAKARASPVGREAAAAEFELQPPHGKRRCRPSWRLHQATPGLPEGDEGIADLESLDNPAKDTNYGDDGSLQYGVSSAAAGPSDQFFSADTRVVFGVNALEIGLVELFDMGLKRALIVTGWNQARADPIVWELLPRGFELAWHSVSTEPSLTDVAKGVSLALDHQADCVLAMGGAAVIDAAKAVAAIAYADKDPKKAAKRLLAAASQPRDTVPDAGAAEEVDLAPLLGPIPLVAIPIIAGVGAEVTPMATILDDDDPVEPDKVTVGFHNSAAAMPAPFMAIVEPRLMMRVPLETTWSRAFVALAGCIEGYVAGRGFVPDLLSHQGIERVSRCLSRELGFRGPLYEEREDIAFAGVIRGLVASRNEWSFLHQLASAVAVASGAPYAECVSRLLPRVLEAQISGLRREEEAFADPSPRRRQRPRSPENASPTDATNDGSAGSSGGDFVGSYPEVVSQEEENDSWEAEGAGDAVLPSVASGRRSSGGGVDGDSRASSEEDRYARACAALLKYRRVAKFVTGDDKGSAPEAIVGWLDARLLDKNVASLYRAGLRPEHAVPVVEALREGAGRAMDGEGQAFGGLGEDMVMAIVLGEAAPRKDGDGTTGGAGGEGAVLDSAAIEELSMVAPAGPAQTGPWQK